MLRLCIIFTLLFLTNTSFAQDLLFEDFEEGILPNGWTQQTVAADEGWMFGEATSLSSSFWTIISNGSKIAATNDDRCNCDKIDDYLITPPINLGNINNTAALEVDVLFIGKEYQNTIESATIEVSTDGGSTWTEIKEISGAPDWQKHIIDLSAFTDEVIHIGFHYSDNESWLYGMAIDNVKIFEPIIIDAAMTNLEMPFFGIVNQPMSIKGQVTNFGSNPINTLEVTFETQEQLPETTSFEGLDISYWQKFDFIHDTQWIPQSAGNYDFMLKISDLNGGNDFVPENDFLTKELEIFDEVDVPNIINNYILAPYNINTIASGNEINMPTDLDFFPALSKNELWVVNERTVTEGGNAVIISNAGKEDQDLSIFEDVNAYNSMSLPTSIAFGMNGNWATGSGAQDANHNGGIYSGPTLWSGNPAIYAQDNANGSHLDMLHSSPHTMGIAHEIDNIYWAFDGFKGEIVRYDFQGSEEVGSVDFSDGIVRRYTEIKVKKEGDIPSHMIYDETSNWLYIVDTGNQRILRLKTTSGQVVQALPIVIEPLAEHSRVGGVDWEVVVKTNLQQPSGIEILGNRLLVSDYATGEIIIYSINNDFEELGRIETGSPGICGIKIGPEGNIWYTNRLDNAVMKITSTMTTATTEPDFLTIKISPNPTSGIINIGMDESYHNATLRLTNIAGQIFLERKTQDASSFQLNLSNYPKGIYFLNIQQADKLLTQKIVVE